MCSTETSTVGPDVEVLVASIAVAEVARAAGILEGAVARVHVAIKAKKSESARGIRAVAKRF